ncbi:MAG: hypothetical protein HF982_10710 [Desulfobacteraceae bacterium]|nr:hypothetical protein [Desulfobacteraceae bacterium]MBC2720036.1 hypothetical protein [Desulfobacteraceae bacterium]
MSVHWIMAADVPVMKEGIFHTQIIFLKEDPAKTEDAELIGEMCVILTEKV